MNQKKNLVDLEKNPILNSKLIYFVGIGGIGMSGIAEILHNLGYKVKGSDLSENANVKRLKKLGVSVAIGQDAKNIEGVDLVVRSSAVKDDNPEVKAAIENSIAVILRADMLAEIMRLKESIAVAGTHGKTTTTSMVTAMFEAAKLDPTVINGGIINSYGTNARLGGGKWMVAEADESDGTFLRLPASVGIITNIDPEHMEHYGSYDNLLDSFNQFIENLAFYGFGVLCNDHEEVAKLAKKITSRKIITYAIDCDADVRAINIEYNIDSSVFDVEVSDRLNVGKKVIKSITLPMPGKHNISNALAAIATACEMEFDDEVIRNGFNEFKGVKRRFTKTGEVDGITIIDDYGHHPKEISVTLSTAKKSAKGDIIAVVQPHRYSRVQDLFDDFCESVKDADKVVVTSIFEAGEKPIEGISNKSLAEGMKNKGTKEAIVLDDLEQLPQIINKIAKKGDIVICLGAGSITSYANNLPEELRKIKNI